MEGENCKKRETPTSPWVPFRAKFRLLKCDCFALVTPWANVSRPEIQFSFALAQIVCRCWYVMISFWEVLGSFQIHFQLVTSSLWKLTFIEFFSLWVGIWDFSYFCNSSWPNTTAVAREIPMGLIINPLPYRDAFKTLLQTEQTRSSSFCKRTR